MKKNLFILIVLLILFVVGCFGPEPIDQKKKTEIFELQKTYILRQHIFDFMPFYNVWKSLPLNVMDYPNLKAIRNDKYYTARKLYRLVSDDFIIIDKVNNKNYYLEEVINEDNPENLILYSIKEGDKVFVRIEQIDLFDNMNFHLKVQDKSYQFSGKILRSDRNQDLILGFEFDIKNSDVLLGKIRKNYLYLKNEYEVIINRDYNDLADVIYINLGVFADQLLREQGLLYKGQ